MSRTFILAAGAILWAVVAIVGVAHVLDGTWTSAAMMVLLGVVWITVRLAPWSPLRIRPRARVLPADPPHGSNSIESTIA